MKEFYYYFRDNDNHPRITICLMENDSCYHRGMALCSFSEKELSKKAGRKRARSRAIKAMKTFVNSDPISREEAREILRDCRCYLSFSFKSMYGCELTGFERIMVAYDKEKSV